MQWRSGVAFALLACGFSGEAAADVQLSHGMTQATVGGTLTISASLVDPGPYTMSLTDPSPAQGTVCAARLAGPTKAVRGRIKLTGKVPSSLACYASDGTLLTHAKTTAGVYTLYLCQSDGPTSCDGSKTVIHTQVIVHAAPKAPRPKSHRR